MPFTKSTVPDHVPADKAEAWAMAWNSAFDRCKADNGEGCEPRAFAVANALLEDYKPEQPTKTQALLEHVELVEGTLDHDARTVEVVIIRPGWSRNSNGPYYPATVLAEAAERYENSRSFANHPTIKEMKENKGARRVEDMTGRIFNVHVGNEGELRGTRKVYDNPAGNAVWPAIVDSIENKVAAIALSINSFGKAKKGTAPDGKKGMMVESIDIVNSVDDVVQGAAGGSFEAFAMSGDTLLSDLLSVITYDEFTAGRPDFVERMKKEWSKVRQTNAVTAANKEREGVRGLLEDEQADHDKTRETVTALEVQIQTKEAEIVKLRESLAQAAKANTRKALLATLERELAKAKLRTDVEQELREELENTEPEQWLDVLAKYKRLAKASDVQTQVPVTTAPLRQQSNTPMQEHVSVAVREGEDFNAWSERISRYQG